MNGLYYSGLKSMLGPWARGVGAILMLHHVRPGPTKEFAPNAHLEITPEFLDQLLTRLKEQDYEFISLDALHKRLGEKNLHRYRKMIVMTLDDGYRNNLELAAPIFRKHQIPYTIFIAPGLVDGRADLWWEDLAAVIGIREHISLSLSKGRLEFDVSTLEKKQKVFGELLSWLTNEVSEEEQRRIVRELAWMYKIDPTAHCREQIMSWKEIYEVSKDPLCTIGAHTIHHYAVARLDEQAAEWEMRESARILEAELGYLPAHLAFPYGYPAAAGYRDFELARKLGFKTALTTRHGMIRRKSAIFPNALPRISINGNFQNLRYLDTLLSGIPELLMSRGR